MVLKIVEDDNRFKVETQDFSTFWFQDTPFVVRKSPLYPPSKWGDKGGYK